MVNSRVPEVVLKNGGSIELTVQVAGFVKGMPVEVYGYVTQNSGAFVSFRRNWIISELDADGSAKLPVDISPKELKLAEDEPVTVVTWVSEVWPSMLDVVDTPRTEGILKVWKIKEDAWGSNAAPAGEKDGGTGPAS